MKETHSFTCLKGAVEFFCDNSTCSASYLQASSHKFAGSINMGSIHNLTINISDTALQPLFGPAINTIIIVIYMVVSIIVIASNFFVCLLFYEDKSMRRPFSIILLNVSLADLMSGIAIQPYIWVDFTRIKDNGNIAGFLCSISVGLLCFMYCVATLTLSLCAVTVLRYLSIVRNYRGYFVTSKNFTAAFCLLTWMAGAGLTVPSGMSFKYDQDQSICRRTWPQGVSGGLFSILTTLIYLVLPIVLMVICYALLAIHIWQRSATEQDRNIAAVRARKGVSLLLGFLIFSLVLCWSPFATVWILGRVFQYFSDGTKGEYERQRWLRIATLFALLNSALDPFIYVYSSADYRRGTLKMLRRFRDNAVHHDGLNTMVRSVNSKRVASSKDESNLNQCK